jgi:hypothetical protein
MYASLFEIFLTVVIALVTAVANHIIRFINQQFADDDDSMETEF